MIGLLYKDQMVIWSGYRKNFILLVLLYSAMAFTMDTPFMLFALLFVGGMYTTSTLVLMSKVIGTLTPGPCRYPPDRLWGPNTCWPWAGWAACLYWWNSF